MYRLSTLIGSLVFSIVLYSASAYAQFAAPTVPATSSNGSYTVTWTDNSGLMERYNGGGWTVVQNQYISSAKSFSGKPGGTYEYKTFLWLDYPFYITLYSEVAQIVVAASAPAMPAGFTVPGTSSTGSYTVSWNAVAGANSYTLQGRINSGSWSTLQISSATSRAESSLVDGSYAYRVRACNSVGCSSYTAAQTTVVSNPQSPPTVPSTSTTGNYTVSWNSTWGLQEQVNGGTWTTVQAPGNSSRTFTNKSSGTYRYRTYLWIDYPFYISLYSGEAQIVVTVPAPTAPPTTFAVPASASNGSYTLSWSAVTNATRYQLQEKIGGGNWTTVQNTSALSKAYSGKTDNTYSYRIRACNDTGCSNFSATKSVFVLHIPGIPTAISGPATDIDGSYSLSWGASSGIAATYRLQEQTNTGSWITVQDSAALSHSFSSKPDNRYNYRVAGCNVSGCSGWTATKTVDVARVPGIPSNVTGSPAQTVQGDYTVTWQASTGSVTQYQLQQAVGTSSWSTVYTGSSLSRSFTGQSIGNYSYRVRACNVVGNFSSCSQYGYSNVVVVASLILSAPTLSTGDYTVSWSGSDTGAQLWLQESVAGGAWATLSVVGANGSYGLSNKPIGDYSYRITQNICGFPQSGQCIQIPLGNSVTVSVVPVVPGAISVAATDLDGSYPVSWGASGSGVNYVLQERSGAGAWTTLTLANPAGLSHQVSGKGDGVYDYRVQACRVAACSDWTAVESITVAITPTTPSSLSVAPLVSSDGTLSTSWAASSGSVTQYELQQWAGSANWTQVYSNTGLTYFVGGLGDGVYRFRVRACNVVNNVTACSGYRQSPDATVQLVAGIADPVAPVLATAPAPDSTSDSIGVTAGEFRVDESGSATYRIPVATPAGTAGVTPQLSLAYSSQAGNGLMGQGWRLAGPSAITRCRQTLAQDGQAMPITWSEDDRFCLDGQRLVLVSAGQYGSVGATYKTETDRFATITSVGGTTGHPDHFTVEAKDGSLSTYGNTGDSTLQLGGNTLTWSQNRFTDSVGNAIDYVYASTGSHRLIEVRYAYGLLGTPGASITLDYDDNREDIISGYVAGYSVSTTHRLSGISVLNEGQVVRQYQLSYADVSSRDNKTSQLTQLQECLGVVCLPATQFTWADQAVGLNLNPESTTTFSSKSDRGLYSYQPADINGDGYMDLVWLEWDVDGSDTDHHLHYKLSDGTALNNAVFTNNSGSIEYGEDVNSETVITRIIDYNVDGRQDVIVYNSRTGQWRVLLSTPQTDGTWRLSSTPLNTGVTEKDASFIDINSDGLVDAVYMRGRSLYRQLLEVNTSEPLDSDRRYHFGVEMELGALDTSEFGSLYPDYQNTELTGNLDFNGDGIGDLYLNGYERLYLSPTFPELTFNMSSGLNLSESGFEPYFIVNDIDSNVVNSAVRSKLKGADFNGDGLSDIVYKRSDGTDNWYYQLNTGAGFTAESMLEVTGEEPTAVDYNQDGYPDLVWRDTTTNTLKVQVWNGSGFNASMVLRSVSSSNHAHLFFDMNGDGVVDYVRVEDNNLKVYSSVSPHLPRNKVIAITNGLGNQTHITYGSLSHSGRYSRIDVSTSQTCNTFEIPFDVFGTGTGGPVTYCTTDAGSFYSALNGDWLLPTGTQTLGKDNPVLELTGPMYVVTDVASGAPAASSLPGNINSAAQSSISYYYGEAKIQASGRGLLGFQTIKTVDNQTGVGTTTVYRQDFPFIGFPQTTEVRSSQGHLLSRATNTWALKNWNSGNPSAPYQPFIATSIEETYNLISNGSSQGDLLHTVTTQNAHDDHGNVDQITITNTDASGSVVMNKVVDNTYDTDPWGRERGRLLNTIVTTTRGSDSNVRTSAFTYYASGPLRGLLETETIEPNNTAYRLVTTYQHDGMGNRIRVTQSDSNTANDRVSETTYDSRGRYVNSTINSYGQTTSQVLLRDALGQPLRVSDINGVITEMAYGALGRNYFKANATGGFSHTWFSHCDASCPASGVYIVHISEAGGAQRSEIFDNLGRSIRSAVRQFDGSWGYVDTEYDSLGRVKRKSEPHSGVALYWTEFEYDILGRVTRTDLPGIGNPVTVSYNGLTTVTTNPAGQSKTVTNNVLGEPVEVLDAERGRIGYQYDASGNLRFATSYGSTLDPHVVTVQMQYDLLGRKTLMHDPDKGNWTYAHNTFGELTLQTDGKSQTSTLGYDRMGRLVSRIDRLSNQIIESNTTWAYNNATSGTGLGSLVGVQDAISGYTQIINYDPFGRAEDTITTLAIGDTHYEKITYDQYGRTFQVFDAAGDGLWQNHAVQNNYNSYGYLHEVVDAQRLLNGEPRTRYYVVNEMDLRGNVIEATRGNGVTSYHNYDAATGRLNNLLSEFAPGLGDIQDHEYNWDDLGNLLNRNDLSGNKNISESFAYDGLNRLVQYQVAGQAAKTVSYNSLGNITSKSDVGNYSYGNGAGPHAVTSTSDGVNYTYDANGNLISDTAVGNLGGRTLNYTTFDKPDTITKGSQTTTFKYGPNRARYLRTDTNASGTKTTRYIGSVEKITLANNSREVRRYLPGGALVTEYYDNSNTLTDTKTRYIYKDHLGSTDVITDAVGVIEQELSFDAWGQRRSAVNWNDLSMGSLLSFDNSITARGYTGHEGLDEVGLVHMNGRIYDPRLGRFLQADPFIDGVSFTQGYNRYSYVYNNPLNATDPTGHFVFTLAAIAYTAAVEGIKWYVASAIFAAAGFTDALVQGASFGDALKAGVISGVSAAAFHGIGEAFSQASASNISQGLEGLIEFGSHGGEALMLTGGQVAGKIAAHAAVGGVMSVLQGGEFGHGFVSAGIVGAASPAIGKIDGLQLGDISLGQVAASAILGGTVSKLSGGKFANGAITGSFQNLFNQQGLAARKSNYTVSQTVGKNGVTTIDRLDSNGKIVASLTVDKGVTIRTDAFRDQLLDLSQQEGGASVRVISGYRSQAKQNGLVASGNVRAAKLSQHTVGLAADIRISGMTARQASLAAYKSGLFNRVNLYTTSNSVHVDQRPGYKGYYGIDWRRQKNP